MPPEFARLLVGNRTEFVSHRNRDVLTDLCIHSSFLRTYEHVSFSLGNNWRCLSTSVGMLFRKRWSYLLEINNPSADPRLPERETTLLQFLLHEEQPVGLGAGVGVRMLRGVGDSLFRKDTSLQIANLQSLKTQNFENPNSNK